MTTTQALEAKLVIAAVKPTPKICFSSPRLTRALRTSTDSAAARRHTNNSPSASVSA